MAETDILDIVRWMLPEVGDPCEAALLAVDYCDSTGRKLSGHSEYLETLLIVFHNLIVGGVVQHHRGFLVKFTGDGCLAAFTGERGPAKAVEVAVAAHERISVLNGNLREAARILTKCGIHYGTVRLVDYDRLFGLAPDDRWAGPCFQGLDLANVAIPCSAGDPHGLAVDPHVA